MASSGMPWIKLYNEFLDDPKIGQLSDASQLLFIKLLLVAGECDAEGALVNGQDVLTIDDLAWRLRMDITKLDMALTDLSRVALIDRRSDGTITVTNFSKRQGRPQSVKREQWRERQRRKRDSETDQKSVTRDTTESHAPRVEQSREEQSREEQTTPDKSRATARDGVDPVSRQALESLGIRGENLWEALQHPRDRIVKWCEYATQADGVANPAGLVITRLRQNEDPPDTDEVWYTDDEYERHIKGVADV